MERRQASLQLAMLLLLLLPVMAVAREKQQIYLAGTFPISGSEGWQGGQGRPQF